MAESDVAFDKCVHGVDMMKGCFACMRRTALHDAHTAGLSSATDANAKQVGGGHYKGTEYQHWDFVTDIDLPYLPAVATKYVYRWRKKNGKEDLEKARHYLEKCIERDIHCPQSLEVSRLVGRFMMTLPDITDAHIIGLIVTNNYEIAIREINVLLAQLSVEQGPSSDQERNQPRP